MLPPFPHEIISLILHYVLLPTSPSSSPDRSPSFRPLRSEAQTDFLFSLNSLTASPNWAKPAGDRLWRDLHVGVKQEAHSIILALKQDRNRLGDAKRGTAGKVKVLHLEIRQYRRELPSSSPPTSPILAMPQPEPEQPDGVTPLQIAQLADLLPNLDTICLRANAVGAWFLDTEIVGALKMIIGREGFKHLEVDSHFLGIPNILSLSNHSPRLETLKLKNLKWNSSSPEYEKIVPEYGISLFRNLKSLTLSNCYLSHDSFDLIFTSISYRPSILTTLILHELHGTMKVGSSHPVPFPYQAALINKLHIILPWLHHFHFVLAPSSEPFDADQLVPSFGRSLRRLVLGGHNLHFHDKFCSGLLRVPSLQLTSLTLFPLPPSCGIDLIELGKILQDAWADELVLLDLEGATEARDPPVSSTGAREGERWLTGGERYLEERVERVNRARREEERSELILRI